MHGRTANRYRFSRRWCESKNGPRDCIARRAAIPNVALSTSSRTFSLLDGIYTDERKALSELGSRLTAKPLEMQSREPILQYRSGKNIHTKNGASFWSRERPSAMGTKFLLG